MKTAIFFFGNLMPPTFPPFEGIGKEFADLRQIFAQRVHYILSLLSTPVYCKRLGTRLYCQYILRVSFYVLMYGVHRSRLLE